ncbi:type II toxin-antitoxin system RelE/ParE family toxin [Pseudomonas mosselii]|uniref:type II toxin-antitoxin system RelE/ParE family toxin n=1 Tax=Pseudomonas mosselii TaxID=78327 RepID=UPI000A0F7CC9|nr:type II toxin-antitoxin system RelE/ParE family toxin [Pseudomonas mosselii]MDH1655886.1 type II toxin-antitoxin system RelE/ParE family toxin [Pseudomonas mosselii]MDH1715547.1 type II toxin-antitoxin system RelE/ParE family toxin [Pseudomonas mosselii]MDH1720238.1 type II toxin-antitoxin system RelE/ParE family toxin [Pseudomonas mosselii]MDN4499154.1 type II toxin-antitoxin system RelE/ParE family toxin [Pseudomonas mosselii]MEB5930587.1 type II toxin-antitoxin system RelE/ParE family to
MDVYKRREFARWQLKECVPDHLLCRAVLEMQSGLVDASLGGLLFKKRVAGLCSGKRGGYRTLLSARIGSRYVFLHGFAKSDMANVTPAEQKALQFAGRVFLQLSPHALATALGCGVLMEVHCDQQAH